jgi:hypothetical protein
LLKSEKARKNSTGKKKIRKTDTMKYSNLSKYISVLKLTKFGEKYCLLSWVVRKDGRVKE